MTINLAVSQLRDTRLVTSRFRDCIKLITVAMPGPMEYGLHGERNARCCNMLDIASTHSPLQPKRYMEETSNLPRLSLSKLT